MKNIDELVKEHYNSKELTLDQFDTLTTLRKAVFGFGVWKYAAVFTLIAASIVIFRIVEERKRYQIVYEYAQEVALNHEKQLQSDIVSNDITDLGNEMDKLDFKVVLPQAIDSEYTLKGGRYCSIKTSIAAQLKVENASGAISTLYVFKKTGNFEIDNKIILQNTEVTLWDNNELVFALASTL